MARELGEVRRAVKRWIRRTPLWVRHRSAAVNVYHCCVQKTASQWIRRLVADPRVQKHSGLRRHNHYKTLPGGYDPNPLDRTSFPAFPERTIVSPLYTGYEGFRSIPKPDSYRAFFVSRDPRDVAVSWYFSITYSHTNTGDGILLPVRERLRSLDKREGLMEAIRLLAENTGLFEALRSWVGAEEDDPDVRVVSYAELVSDRQFEAFRDLFRHCDIAIPDAELEALLEDHSFEKRSGRRRGVADPKSHLRRGVAGDWTNHFDDEVMNAFRSATGDLVEVMGVA